MCSNGLLNSKRGLPDTGEDDEPVVLGGVVGTGTSAASITRSKLCVSVVDCDDADAGESCIADGETPVPCRAKVSVSGESGKLLKYCITGYVVRTFCIRVLRPLKLGNAPGGMLLIASIKDGTTLRG